MKAAGVAFLKSEPCASSFNLLHPAAVAERRSSSPPFELFCFLERVGGSSPTHLAKGGGGGRGGPNHAAEVRNLPRRRRGRRH